MPANNPAISIRGLSKAYTIAHNAARHTTLAQTVLHRLRHPFERRETETFWALKDVSFDVSQGDVVGIVGRNGAGKSTLLKVLSRITTPTAGAVDLYGRVGSLLEVGTGFHPELTGRENTYLNGHILGMRKKEIDKQFDAIVDFAGVEQFLDTPVKRYSSGMYVRLAFAVAAHLPCEVLVVDEVLAVGDAEFQKKCLGKMKDVAVAGRTVLFVSHHIQSVRALCTRAVLLDRGSVVAVGGVDETIDKYLSAFNRPVTAATDARRRPGSGALRFVSVTPERRYFTCAEPKVLRFEIAQCTPLAAKFYVAFMFFDELGNTVLYVDSRSLGGWFDPADCYRGEVRIRTPWFKPGTYRVAAYVFSHGLLDHHADACEMAVAPILPYDAATTPDAISHGAVLPDFDCGPLCGAGDETDRAAPDHDRLGALAE